MKKKPRTETVQKILYKLEYRWKAKWYECILYPHAAVFVVYHTYRSMIEPWLDVCIVAQYEPCMCTISQEQTSSDIVYKNSLTFFSNSTYNWHTNQTFSLPKCNHNTLLSKGTSLFKGTFHRSQTVYWTSYIRSTWQLTHFFAKS